MQVWLICSEAQEQELGALPAPIIISRDIQTPPSHFDGVIDLLFEANEEAHLEEWTACAVPVIVASLVRTCSQLPPHCTRINAWPGFLQKAIWEACSADEQAKTAATRLLAFLGKQPDWVPDLPGMIAARVVASIINEAYLAFAEGVASRKDIDTAMKLGTNYPYGPFEWAEKIGPGRVAALLHALAAAESRYQPSALLAAS